MAYRLSPPWLVILYSIAGYSEAEIAEIGGWSLRAIRNSIKTYGILPSEHTKKGEDIRRYIDAIRTKDGNAAALRAVRNLLIEIAGPPIRVYR